MKGDRNNSKRSKKYSITKFLSSFKMSFPWQGKLTIIGIVFSIFLVGLTCFFQIDRTKDTINFIAFSQGSDAYYDRLEEVRDEYNDEDKEFSELVITSTFSIMQNHIEDFSYDDMSKNRMREVADLMLNEAEHDDGSVTYTAKGEEAVKKSLADYFKDVDPSLPDVTCKRMAEDVYDYVDDYLDFIGENETEGTNSTGNMCTYDVNGEAVSGLKVRLMQAGSVGSLGHCGGTYGEPMEGEELVDFEKYVLGVAYAEIGEAPEAAFKAQLIMARTFALQRPSSMNNANGLKLAQENGQWILQITNCVSDQVYCDPDKGCSKDGSSQYNMLYSGLDHSVTYKGPLPEDSQLRTWAKEVAGKVLVDSSGDLVTTSYNSSRQNSISDMANAGYDYTDILVNIYGSGVELTEANCTSDTGDWANWKQYNESWSNVPIGASGKNIRQIGCLATSISMLVAKSGVISTSPDSPFSESDFNPGTFVQTLNDNNGFTSGGALNWYSVTNILPNFKFVGKTTLSGMGKSDKLDTISSQLEKGYYCTVEVKGSTGQHWVAVDRVEGNTIYMYDPASTATDMWNQYNWSNTSDMGCFSVGS